MVGAFPQAEREVLRLRDALESIRRYGLDTLSGRVDGPDDRAWQRAAVNEMTKRARLALEGQESAASPAPAPQQAEPRTEGAAPAHAPDAWMHEEDETRVISAAQKAQALRDGGASASSVTPYSVPLTRGVQEGGKC